MDKRIPRQKLAKASHLKWQDDGADDSAVPRLEGDGFFVVFWVKG